jgi:hypothetical protein
MLSTKRMIDEIDIRRFVHLLLFSDFLNEMECIYSNLTLEFNLLYEVTLNRDITEIKDGVPSYIDILEKFT